MKRLLFVLVVFAASCTEQDVRPATAVATDVQCEAPQRIASLPSQLREASGVAVSRRNPGILWVHNDSGDPILFALDTLGKLRGQVRITNVGSNSDWEDIAVGDCDEGTCIYIGAIGDNLQQSTDRAIYRVPEPEVTATSAASTVTIPYVLEKPEDAEALFVVDRDLFVITKGRSGPITVYGFPPNSSGTAVLQPIQELSEGLVQLPEMVTGAGATPDGRHVLIRTYSGLQIYSFSEKRLQPLHTRPFSLQSLNEPQGEGADITEAGVVYLVSEKSLGDSAPPLSKVVCDLSAR